MMLKCLLDTCSKEVGGQTCETCETCGPSQTCIVPRLVSYAEMAHLALDCTLTALVSKALLEVLLGFMPINTTCDSEEACLRSQ